MVKINTNHCHRSWPAGRSLNPGRSGRRPVRHWPAFPPKWVVTGVL